MELTKHQSEQFIKRYKDRYGDSKELPIANNETLEIKEWKQFLRELLWKKTDTMYKKRSWGKETILDKVFNSLWLAYWPIIK